MKFTSCDLEVIISQPEDIYTNGDVLQGIARVTLRKDISIRQIVLSLRCKELATYQQNVGNTTITHMKKYRHHNDQVIVFPPPHITGSAHTLPAGTHEFDFSFQIPLNATLETFKVDFENYIKWYIKARVYRETKLKTDTRKNMEIKFVPVRFNPALKPETLPRHDAGLVDWDFKAHNEGFKRSVSSFFSNKDRTDVDLSCDVEVSSIGLLQAPFESTLELTINTSSPGYVFLDSLKVVLHGKDRSIVDGLKSARNRYTDLVVLQNVDMPLKGPVTLTDILKRKEQPTLILSPEQVGTFATMNSSTHYYLLVEAVFKSQHYPGHHSKRKLKVPINVVSANVCALRGQTPGSEYQYPAPVHDAFPFDDDEVVNPPVYVPNTSDKSPLTDDHLPAKLRAEQQASQAFVGTQGSSSPPAYNKSDDLDTTGSPHKFSSKNPFHK